jgi:squalene-hopene/tetraprenyl-beta-curcumene cyclase
MNRSVTLAGILALCSLPLGAQQNQSAAWNQKAAASYIDNRLDWWIAWPKSARDHETFCVSCHTAVPFALSRHNISTPSAPEEKLIANVTKRVHIWNEAEPFYNDKGSGPNKSYESRGTESVFNALILVTADPAGDAAMQAFKAMWEQQITTAGDRHGSFPWLEFHNRPWEADDSPYYGASMAAIAVGSAPAAYQARPDVKEHVEQLRDYLRREFAKQSPVNRVNGLWADTKIHGILTADQRSALTDELYGLQQADGGWSTTSIAGVWKRHDDTPLETRSDGYGTGFITFVLQQAGVAPTSPNLRKGIAWLVKNQDQTEGLWPAWSLNKNRTDHEAGLFMTDAATAFAVMSLTAAK